MSYVTVAVGVATAFTALSKARQGKADAQAKQMEGDYQADQEQQASQQQAEIIRRAGQYAQSRATAAYAGSGVQVDSGSAEVVNNQIGTDTAHDAYQTILNGTRRADSLRATGKIGQVAATVAGDQFVTGTVLQQGAKMAGAWSNS